MMYIHHYYSCKHCSKKFSARSGMYRHIKNNCKVVKAKNKENSEIFEKLLKIEKDNDNRIREEAKKNKIIERQSRDIEILKKQSKKDIEKLKKEMREITLVIALLITVRL